MSVSIDELVGFSDDEEDEARALGIEMERPRTGNRDLDLITAILEQRSVYFNLGTAKCGKSRGSLMSLTLQNRRKGLGTFGQLSISLTDQTLTLSGDGLVLYSAFSGTGYAYVCLACETSLGGRDVSLKHTPTPFTAGMPERTPHKGWSLPYTQ